MALATGNFWTLPRVAGAIVVGTAALLAAVTLIASLRGDVRAAEAMFRDVEAAVGSTTTLRIIALSWGAWTISVLAGFVVLAVELWNRGARLIPALAVVGLTVFAVVWVIEAAFHSGVTVWAVSQLERGDEVPALFVELKKWLNLWSQVLVNPLALLSFLGLAVVAMRNNVLPPWAGWAVVVSSGLFVFFPLPLAIAPIALFFGMVLLTTA